MALNAALVLYSMLIQASVRAILASLLLVKRLIVSTALVISLVMVKLVLELRHLALFAGILANMLGTRARPKIYTASKTITRMVFGATISI
jgi:hypothetical protein